MPRVRQSVPPPARCVHSYDRRERTLGGGVVLCVRGSHCRDAMGASLTRAQLARAWVRVGGCAPRPSTARARLLRGSCWEAGEAHTTPSPGCAPVTAATIEADEMARQRASPRVARGVAARPSVWRGADGLLSGTSAFQMHFDTNQCILMVHVEG